MVDFMILLITALLFFITMLIFDEKLEKIDFKAIFMWLVKGDFVAKIGTLILSINIGYFMSYLAERNILPPEIRILLMGFVGSLMYFGGNFINSKENKKLSLALNGGGFGVLYMTIYMSLNTYGFLKDEKQAFIFFIVLSIVCAINSMKKNAVSLALISMSGAFMAPYISFGNNLTPFAFFSYYLVLDITILYLSYQKDWKGLNYLSFFFVLCASLFFGFNGKYYSNEYYNITEPFLIVFFLIHFAMPLVYAFNKESLTKNAKIDIIMIILVPFVTFGLQCSLVNNVDKGIMLSAIAFGVFYLGAWLLNYNVEKLQSVNKLFLFIGLVFIVISIPFVSNNLPLAGIFSLISLLIVISGYLSASQKTINLGIVFHYFTVFLFIFAFNDKGNLYLNQALIGISALFSVYFMKKMNEKENYYITFVWGSCWLLSSVIEMIDFYRLSEFITLALICFVFGLTSLLVSVICENKAFNKVLHKLTTVTIFIIWALSFIDMKFYLYDSIVWFLSILCITLNAFINKDVEKEDGEFEITFFDFAIFGAVAMFVWLFDGVLSPKFGIFYSLSFFISVLFVLLSLFNVLFKRSSVINLSFYLIVLWNIYASIFLTEKMPIINELEFLQIFIFVAILISYVKGLLSLDGKVSKILVGLGIILFIHALILRVVGNLMGIEYNLLKVLMSIKNQGIISFVWALISLSLMYFANLKGLKTLWSIGGVIVILIGFKFFLIDINNANALINIASGLGVGAVLLFISYFAPFPKNQ
ncbi:MAG: hypothetical protein BWY78_00383 [Alphaproteobacteria bacterium ADurb.Bin438]|nr:MAG: hypothetical protein BWY78_00383 [Alphaproteobacteria bacterium ADurb.Bin438]